MLRNSHRLIGMLFGVTAACSLVAATGAMAENVTGKTGDTANAAEASATVAPAELQEIVVTAQRRNERAIDVPMAITSLTGENLTQSGISNTSELGQVVPGLMFTQNAGYTTITVRGIGSSQNTPAASNDVAIYLDGSYQSSKTGGIFDLPDISSVEVLKGPQGTLWGRNATGGAVLIKTLDPQFTPSATATISYGTYSDQLGKLFVTGPLVDGLLAGSVAGYYEDRKGFVTNLATGVEDAGGLKSSLVRAKLLLTPAEGISFLLSGFYSDRIDRDSPLEGFPGGLTFGSSGLLFNANAITGSAPQTVSSRFTNQFWENRTVHVSLDANFETSMGKFSSISSYTDVKAPAFTDLTYTSAQGVYGILQQPDKSYSEELNFASVRLGPVQFLAGADYYHDSSGFEPLLVYSGAYPGIKPILTSNNVVIDEAVDGYVEGDVNITDRLDFIVGVRYTHEKAEEFGSLVANSYPRVHASVWNEPTPRASLRYTLAENTNIYLTYSQGFKSGTFDTNNAAAPPVNPEKVDGFEFGIKSDLSRAFSVNASAFYGIYKDIQVAAISNQSIATGLNFNEILNAAQAKVYGIDLDAVFRPITNLTFDLKVETLHATYSNFPDAVVNLPKPLSSCPPTAYPIGCGSRVAAEDATGNRLENAPKFSGTLSMNYVLHPAIGDVALNANLFATGKFYWDIANLESQPAYHVLNARLSWSPLNGHTTLTLWGKNLSNEYYTIGTNVSAGGILWAPGRAVGVEASVKF